MLKSNAIQSFFLENSSHSQIIIKNSFWLYAGQFLSKAIKFFLVIAAARILGPTEYGLFSFAVYTMGLIFMGSDLGVNIYFIRDYQKAEQKTIFTSKIYYLKLLLILGTIILGCSGFLFIHDPALKSIYFVVLAFYSLNALKDFFTALTSAQNKMQMNALALVIDSAATSIIGLILLFSTQSLFFFVCAYLVGSIISTLCVSFLMRKDIPRPRRIGLSEIRAILAFCFPFLFGSVVMLILSEIGMLMLKIHDGSEAVGYYSASLRIMQFAMIIVSPFLSALFPVLSDPSKRSILDSIVKQSISVTLVVAIPITIITLFFSSDIVQLLLGAQYLPSTQSFRILSAVIPIYFIIAILDSTLNSLNYQLRNMLFTITAAVTSVVLNIFLIPIFHWNGAALSTLLAQTVNLLITYRLLRKIIGRPLVDWKALWQYWVAASGMALVILLCSFLQLYFIISSAVAVAAYGVCLYFLKEKNVRHIGSLCYLFLYANKKSTS